MELPQFDSKEEVMDEMVIMFGADIEDILFGVLQNATQKELEAIYELMTIAYEEGQQEA